MNNEIFLLKLGEIVLKGLNRRRFEDRLMANVTRRLHPYGKFRVYSRQSTVYVEPKEGEACDLDGAWEAIGKVFGIVSMSRARGCEKTPEAFVAAAKEYLNDQLLAAKSFKVETKRADKTFPMTSIELSQYVGGELAEAYPHLTVDVHNPELTVRLEVRDFSGYVHANPTPGPGGLPVGGVSGSGLAGASLGTDGYRMSTTQFSTRIGSRMAQAQSR
jgi:thiamine biosynthesis protein ThiI